MAYNKFSGIEIQVAASILYYDKDTLNDFFKKYEKLTSNPNIIIDGIFDKFVNYLRKFDNFDDDPQVRKENYVNFIGFMNTQNPDKNKRDTFKLWFDKVSELDCPLELPDDIFDHFVWNQFKKSIELIDKSSISFKEKLSVRPQMDFMNTDDDEIINLDDIELEEEFVQNNFTTGIEELDKYVNMVKGNFVVIAARPGVGKSLCMLESGIFNAKNGVKSLYVSLEMTAKQIDKRIVNFIANENIIERYKDDEGNLDFESYKEEYERVKKSRAFSPIRENLKLYKTRSSSADSIINNIEQRIKEGKYEAIFIDYLQLLKYNNLDEWASLRTLTRELKNLAVRNNVLVVTGSQVSRSSTEHGLYLTDLFGSSTIENDADLIIGLENPRERRPGDIAPLTVKVMKQREGDLPEIKCYVNYAIGKINSDT